MEKNMTALVSCFVRAYHYKNSDYRILKDSLAENILGQDYPFIQKSLESGISFFHPTFKGTKEEAMIKEEIGVVLDNMFFPELLSANDIHSIMKDMYKNWDKELFYHYLNEFHLPCDKSIKTLSKGMKKKLEIATALSHHPKLLILDEPTSGLDPVVRSEILDVFLNFIQDENHTILLSTHITSDLEHIADEIIFLDQGKIVLKESRDELLEQYGILKCDQDTFKNISKEDIIRYKKNKYHYEILVYDKKKMAKKYPDCIIDKITLEDLMVLMIKGGKE